MTEHETKGDPYTIFHVLSASSFGNSSASDICAGDNDFDKSILFAKNKTGTLRLDISVTDQDIKSREVSQVPACLCERG